MSGLASIMKVLVVALVLVLLGAGGFMMYGKTRMQKTPKECLGMLHRADVTLVLATVSMLILIGVCCHYLPVKMLNDYYESGFTGTVLIIAAVEAYLICLKRV